MSDGSNSKADAGLPILVTHILTLLATVGGAQWSGELAPSTFPSALVKLGAIGIGSIMWCWGVLRAYQGDPQKDIDIIGKRVWPGALLFSFCFLAYVVSIQTFVRPECTINQAGQITVNKYVGIGMWFSENGKLLQGDGKVPIDTLLESAGCQSTKLYDDWALGFAQGLTWLLFLAMIASFAHTIAYWGTVYSKVYSDPNASGSPPNPPDPANPPAGG